MGEKTDRQTNRQKEEETEQRDNRMVTGGREEAFLKLQFLFSVHNKYILTVTKNRRTNQTNLKQISVVFGGIVLQSLFVCLLVFACDSRQTNKQTNVQFLIWVCLT